VVVHVQEGHRLALEHHEDGVDELEAAGRGKSAKAGADTHRRAELPAREWALSRVSVKPSSSRRHHLLVFCHSSRSSLSSILAAGTLGMRRARDCRLLHGLRALVQRPSARASTRLPQRDCLLPVLTTSSCS
jgi:hypothetical protein